MHSDDTVSPPDLLERFRDWVTALDPALTSTFATLDEAWGSPSVVGRSASVKLAKTPLGRLIARYGDAELRAVGIWAQLRQSVQLHPQRTAAACHQLDQVIAQVSQRRLDWRAEEVAVLWQAVIAIEEQPPYRLAPLVGNALTATERLDIADRRPYEQELRWALRRLEPVNGRWGMPDPARAEELLLSVDARHPLADVTALLPVSGDGFAERLHAELADQLTANGIPGCVRHWKTRAHTFEMAGWKADRVERYRTEWLARAQELRAAAPGSDDVLRQVLAHIPTHRLSSRDGRSGPKPVFLSGFTEVTLVGMVWAAELVDADWVVPLLVDIAGTCATSMGGPPTNLRSWLLARAAAEVLARRPESAADQVARLLGDVAVAATLGSTGAADGIPENAKLAREVIEILAGWSGDGAVGQLARIRAKTKHKGIMKKLVAALDTVATRAGLTPDQLLERTVPTFGLGPDGSRAERAGEVRVVLSLDPTGTPTLTFVGPDGKPRTSVPAAVKNGHPELVVELRGTLKELKQALPVERARIETALADGRRWTAAPWRRYYLDHPVTGAFARALIWECSADGGVTWRSGLPVRDGDGWALTGVDGAAVPVDSEAAVRLWHPVRATLDEVRAWRERLYELELRQPFKQAFREIYLLTPAEVGTGGYSNRFAAHILKYGQAKALLAGRGWSGLQLGYYSEDGETGEAVKELTDADVDTRWRARFFVDLVNNAVADDYGHVGYCATDQVRFDRYDGAGWVAVSLVDVPPLLLSEALRDVDLAVGVASVAADPEWTDRGEERYHDYWRATGFGTLDESAQVRREALARLLPRLKIADRVELTDRFLRVRGSMRSYRIHLGSGNILMEPNDAYLCIVAGRPTSTGKLFLPFEDDRLSLVLSKAFLLADDAKITDETILSQIKGAG
ncbi:hypothetical protein GCM10022225_32770 [Plantactinospora mayteni]|uniref:DUF4132 domain-containing protein n=1 Tax=Plantactinospora mayteni TaxID=566021 RepID=A0ABQ4ELD4_9ACTN|nr:DUF4132 domain-containing protein [Plantactinospora mayteni]GIG95559.1 hypothetical protein Pma05_21320 [Plantactinospora mayteni]